MDGDEFQTKTSPFMFGNKAASTRNETTMGSGLTGDRGSQRMSRGLSKISSSGSLQSS